MRSLLLSQVRQFTLFAPRLAALFACVLSFSLLACSFNYGDSEDAAGDGRPDIVMHEFEYVKVEKEEVRIRLQGEQAERWEDEQRMAVKQARFAQYGSKASSPSASGRAGEATIIMNTGDIVLSGGVQLYLEEEGTIIESGELQWYDESKILISPDNSWVLLKDEDGSLLSGRGFGADIRRRSWEFAGETSGSYFMDDTKEGDQPASSNAPVKAEERSFEPEGVDIP